MRPTDVASRAKMETEFKVAKKARKSSLSAAGQVVASEEGDLCAEHMQQTLTHLEKKNLSGSKLEILSRTSSMVTA